MAVHCPECGFVNPEGANYCQKCGAYLGRPEGADEPTTMTYKVDETGEYTPVDIEEEVEDAGAALVIRSGGGRAGESFQITGDRMSIGRTPDAGVFLDDVTVSRNHALLVRRQDGIYIDDLGSLNGSYVNRRRIESHRLGGRRRDPDRQIQALVPGGLTWRLWQATKQAEAQEPPRRDSRPRKALTIGAVAKILSQEFDDISISKIRYLEDQKLLAPRRTPGGYRLYSQADVERLQAILRMQRDEFLPLRVIRQELATGTFDADRRPAADVGQKRRALTVDSQVQTLSPDELAEQAGVSGRVPARARRVRRRPAGSLRWPPALRRDRPRDRARRRRAGAARRRRPEPSRLSHLRRPRGGAPRAAPGRIASLAQPRAPARGGREPREPRRRLRPPQAAPPGPRPSPPQGRRGLIRPGAGFRAR